MERLLNGYRRFRSETWPAERARYEALAAAGQRPDALVIACSDSRVDPQTVFGAAPGELFVVRNIAALVPPFSAAANYYGTSAVLEFGVRVLQVGRIVVLGHAQCGGVQTIVDGAPKGAEDFVVPWMTIAEPALRALRRDVERDALLNQCETEVVRLSLANLATFPWIKEATAAGKLKLFGFRFAIATGVLEVLDGDRFRPLD